LHGRFGQAGQVCAAHTGIRDPIVITTKNHLPVMVDEKCGTRVTIERSKKNYYGCYKFLFHINTGFIHLFVIQKPFALRKAFVFFTRCQVLKGQVCLHSFLVCFFSTCFPVFIFLEEFGEVSAANATAATPPASTSATTSFFILLHFVIKSYDSFPMNSVF
jgi:hypothetical protein